MSQIRNEANAILLAVVQRMVSLGSSAAQLGAEGREARTARDEGTKILRLLEAYAHESDLTVAEGDAILYCLRGLSGAYDFPTIAPVLGQQINYLIQQIAVLGGGGSSVSLQIQSAGVNLPIRDKLNFQNGLKAVDATTKTNAGLGSPLLENTSIPTNNFDLTWDFTGGGGKIFVFGSDADGDIYYRATGGRLQRLPPMETVSVAGATITFDMALAPFRRFKGSASFGVAKTWAFSNLPAACQALFRFTLSAADVQTFPAGTKVLQTSGFWDSGAAEWTPADPGSYQVEMIWDGTTWYFRIDGPFS